MTDAKIDTDVWQAFLSWPDGYITTDPDEQAEMFEDARGEISIRRRSALPDEDGKLPGNYQGSDIFMELDLDMFDSEIIPAQRELAQKAARGMNRAAELDSLVALTMTPDAGQAFLKALIYAANRIPREARTEGADGSHAEWLEWGASRLDAAIRATEEAKAEEVNDEA